MHTEALRLITRVLPHIGSELSLYLSPTAAGFPSQVIKRKCFLFVLTFIKILMLAGYCTERHSGRVIVALMCQGT